MSIQFAANLSLLRREKNITQKAAAESLGVSQALLSHYEKGIRECNLDFVRRAAEYYDVTADYLLGLSDSKHGTNEIFESAAMPGDSQIKTKTVLRAFIQILTDAEEKGEDFQTYFNDFFALSVKKYITTIENKNRAIEGLCDIAADMSEPPSLKPDDNAEDDSTEKPLCVKTVEDHASRLINTRYENLMR